MLSTWLPSAPDDAVRTSVTRDSKLGDSNQGRYHQSPKHAAGAFFFFKAAKLPSPAPAAKVSPNEDLCTQLARSDTAAHKLCKFA
jgi:hypothetical protein